MVRTCLGFLATLLFLALSPAPAAGQDEKPLIKLGLVLTSSPKIAKGGKDAQAARDAEVLSTMTESFVTSRRFTLVERQELAAVFKEKDLKNFLGKGDNRLSDLLGLDLLGLVDCSVETKKAPQRLMRKVWSKLDPKGDPNEGAKIVVWTLKVRLVDVKTGQVMKVLTSAAPSAFIPVPNIRQAGELLYDHIREAYPPLGAVVKVAGKEVTIDLGEAAGLKKNDVLEIVEEGEQIIHPTTGKVMDTYLVIIGEIKVKELWTNMANARITSTHEGKVIKPGCFVRYKGSSGFLKKTLSRLVH